MPFTLQDGGINLPLYHQLYPRSIPIVVPRAPPPSAIFLEVLVQEVQLQLHRQRLHLLHPPRPGIMIMLLLLLIVLHHFHSQEDQQLHDQGEHEQAQVEEGAEVAVGLVF